LNLEKVAEMSSYITDLQNQNSDYLSDLRVARDRISELKADLEQKES
jgi:hypothetical protein